MLPYMQAYEPTQVYSFFLASFQIILECIPGAKAVVVLPNCGVQFWWSQGKLYTWGSHTAVFAALSLRNSWNVRLLWRPTSTCSTDELLTCITLVNW